jgi:creatinine amidohydrolase
MNAREMHIVSHLIRLLFIGLTMFVSPAFAQIYHVKDMNTEQIKALDREKTVVLLPVGILEEHGPYLPSFSDGYITERRTENLANAIVERPGWRVLIFRLFPWAPARPTRLAGSTYFPALTPCALRPHGLSL